MDGGEAWRVLTCAGEAQDKTIINRIMLRFRPIAPKPVDGDASSGSWKAEEKNRLVYSKRTKRKYVRVKKNIEYRKRKKREMPSPLDRKGSDPTVQLLPPENADLPLGSSSKDSLSFSIDAIVENKERVQADRSGYGGADRAVVVTVESVTDASMAVLGLGSTDMERRKNLERDTCPGFISDGLNIVQWVNEAFRQMVTAREVKDRQPIEVRVMLEVKEKLLPYLYCWKGAAAFTCWVRLQYTWQKDRCCSHMVPCDVWKMEFGGFAWRLDVQAALGLGLESNIGK